MSQGGYETNDADFTPPPADLSEVRRRTGFSAVRHPVPTLATLVAPTDQALQAMRPPEGIDEDDFAEVITNTRNFLLHVQLCIDAILGEPMFAQYKRWLSFAEMTYLAGQHVATDAGRLHAEGTFDEIDYQEFMEELLESSLLLCDAFDAAMLAKLLPGQRRAPLELGTLAATYDPSPN